MKKIRWFTVLMSLVILVITSFQVYWLRDNYHREEAALQERTGFLFKETKDQLRDSIIRQRLQQVVRDTLMQGKKTTIANRKKTDTVVANALRTARVLQTMQSLDIKEDSITLQRPTGNRIMIAINGSTGDSLISPAMLDSLTPDAIKEVRIMTRPGIRFIPARPGTDTIKQLINPTPGRQKIRIATAPKDTQQKKYFTGSFVFSTTEGQKVTLDLDSVLTDTVSGTILRSRFSDVLARENIDVPFTITKADTAEVKPMGPVLAARPAGYTMALGNAFPYLIKKISLPILFSLFLVGLTILSFVLLYRSLVRQHRLALIKNDLISNITHELKTPIATVGVAIEALKNFNAIQDAARTREYLDISQNELQRLELLVDKVLKLSLFENKEIDLNYETCNLGDIVNDVIASLRLQAEKQQALIHLDIKGEPVLQADKLHMLSVVFNLLDNALKYSKENARIEVLLEEKDDTIQLIVSDNGIGIPQQYKDKVFEKFFRVPAGNTHNAKGHGLGLSYAANVIRQHGGSISLNSEEGRGSAFTIQLPKHRA